MKVEFRGTESLINRLNKLSDTRRVTKVINKNTKDLERRMKQNAEFTKGYSTGATKASIESVTENSTYRGVVRPTTDYAPFLINGTRRMEAQDFLRPSLYEQRNQFLSDMARVIKR